MKRKWMFFGSILLSLVFLLPYLVLSVPGQGEHIYESKTVSSPLTVLLLGKDDAAGNTDVILFLRYVPEDGSLAMMQVPRDTYLENAYGSPKINHIYPALLAAGKNEREALCETADTIGDAFSISFDFALSVSTSAVSEIVDRIGGVSVVVPMDMAYTDDSQDLRISLSKGETLLDGEAAEKFLRFRSGYQTGDLGRVDAQKIFLLSFLEAVRTRLDFKTVLSLLLAPPRGVVYTGDAAMLLPLARAAFSMRGETHALIFSAPGEATREERDHGTWYYVLNKNALKEGLDSYFPSKNTGGEFDENGLFYNEKTHIADIYFAADQKITVYDADGISNMIIK